MGEADQTLKRSLVLEAIAKAEDLEPSDDEVRSEITLASQTASDPARTAREAFARPETRSRIASLLRTRKAMDRLVTLAGGVPSQEPTGEPAAEPATEQARDTNGETQTNG